MVEEVTLSGAVKGPGKESGHDTGNEKTLAEVQPILRTVDEDHARDTPGAREASDSGDEIAVVDSKPGIFRPLEFDSKLISTLPESDSDDEWNCITIEDEEDEKKRLEEATELVCYRCPSRKVGTFHNKEKFFIHIKRHTFGEHFNCPTCQRPFTKLTYCLAHEIMEHQTMLEYDSKDPVILKAKRYAERKKIKAETKVPERGEGEKSSQNNNYLKETHNPKTDEQTDSDSEDEIKNEIITSSSINIYRGPKVYHMVECYEIHLNYSNKKENLATKIANIAIQVHKKNVQKKYDTNKLGRFRKVESDEEEISAKKVRTKSKNSTRQAQNRNGNKKRPRIIRSDSEEEKPPPQKRRKVTYQYMSLTSSSESSSSENSDSDYVPSADERGSRKQKKVCIRRTTCTRRKPKQGFSALLERICRQCTYTWKTEEDLRLHRDKMHPNIPILELMIVTGENSQPKPKVNARRNKKKNATRKKAASNTLTHPVTLKSLRISSSIPLVDSSFTEKEKFLYRLGLSNQVRVGIMKKKSLSDLKLKNCEVRLERMTELDVAFYKVKIRSESTQAADVAAESESETSLLENFLPVHFLLG